MYPLSLNQVYFWRKTSSSKYSWDRQFLNRDFLKSEKKRIKDVEKWWINFHRKNLGEDVGEVTYYILPTLLDSNIKASINSKGDFNIFQLSALKNMEQMGMLMILPTDIKMPKDYSLIRITHAKKDYFVDLKTGKPDYVLNVEKYVEEDPSKIYLDIPFEKKRIHKFITENLIKNDSHHARSFQAPISSSPYIKNDGGGVSFSSYSGQYSFSEEFLKTLKMIQPPEFTNLSNAFPISIIKGKKIPSMIKGVSFNVGENYSKGNNYFSGFATRNNQNLLIELEKRKKFEGEYSIACSLTSTSDNSSQRVRELLSKFVRTNLSNVLDLDDLKYTQDLNLFDVQGQINEDLWIQIANQRQEEPSFDQDFNNITFRKKLIQDWKGIMESLKIKNPSVMEASIYAQKTFENIKRVSQSIARDNQVKKVDDFILNESYKLFIKNSEELMLDERIQKEVENIKIEHKNKILEIMQVSLTIKPLRLNELFEEVGSLFKGDILKLQELLDQLKRSGIIYEPSNGYYKWI